MSPHIFEEKTFSKPTYCDYCKKLLWGIAKQGVCCRVCGYVSHVKCQEELVSAYCAVSETSDSLAASRNIYRDIEHKPRSSLNSTESIKSEPILIQKQRSSTHIASESLPAIKVTFELDEKNKTEQNNNNSEEQQNNKSLSAKLKRSNSADSIADYSSNSSNKLKDNRPLESYATLPSLYSSSKSAEYADITPRAAKPISPTKSSFDAKTIQDVLISSVINVSNASKLPSDSVHPPLNLNTTTNNFRKFVQKCGFIFELQGAVEDIIMWKNTPNTLLTMVIYVYICLYPQLLILLPFVGLLSILISYHQKRFPGEQYMNENGKYGGKKRFKRSNRVDPYLPPENSVDYLKNMQNIQNLMGMISDGYDSFIPLLKHVDWSNEYETLKITQIVIVTLSFLSLTVWLVPWRYILVVLGLNVFIANTQFVKALIKEISPVLMQRGKIITQSLISSDEIYGTNNDVETDTNTAGT
ncbi:integral peroxisomal membrane peroxin-domain-containing protein [Glomus cerebriforme]|uniref:Integral peroxisomal membrane peroxin-domain-containing protein n=1 Tax=Glomus cerebriforme TaxID=658196 RepID=A0A397TFB9_9GLOM|nr:integral peroxisomal membrane peroxin-domain-containing protein [Glomus cerebriforme]